ncbi:MAG: site-specific integrase [Solirubrobacteraceae bacterium]
MSEQQLLLAPVEAVLELELVDATIAEEPTDVAVLTAPPLAGIEARNLFGEAQRIAARAASASTRRQYASIFRAFGDWLGAELGRPPVVGDLDADVIAAYGRHLAVAGGRGGRPAAPATSRVYLSMVRALACDLGREDQVDGVRIPRHEPGPPETLTDTDYANLLRVPDRRTLAGKRDYALLSVLGDCGLRSAELRGLRARDLRRPRANARHYRLFVRGKGGREREVPVPLAVQGALDAWVKVHPLTRGVALLDDHPLFVRLGRHGHEQPLPLSAVGVHRLVRRSCAAAGVPELLSHPHALRAYWATHCLEAGVPVHEVSARLGHVDLRTTARYAAPRPERTGETADLLDRAHQRDRRARRGGG